MLKRHLAPQTLTRLLHKELHSGEEQEELTLVTKVRDLVLGKEKEDGKNEE